MNKPKDLSAAAKRIWDDVTRDYEIDDAGSLILLEACRAFDRREEARGILKAEGCVVTDRFGQKKAHPACGIERDSAATLMRAWRLLGLDQQPAGPIGRPPGS